MSFSRFLNLMVFMLSISVFVMYFVVWDEILVNFFSMNFTRFARNER